MSRLTLSQGIETQLHRGDPRTDRRDRRHRSRLGREPLLRQGLSSRSSAVLELPDVALPHGRRESRAVAECHRRRTARRVSPIGVEEIADELARRRLGYGRGPRMRFERDELRLIGGVRHGRTLGSPVAVEILNSEWPKWEAGDVGRPGHARARSRRNRDPVTPTSRACRSTASTTRATSSSAPAPARPRRAWSPARSPRRSCRRSASRSSATSFASARPTTPERPASAAR